MLNKTSVFYHLKKKQVSLLRNSQNIVLIALPEHKFTFKKAEHSTTEKSIKVILIGFVVKLVVYCAMTDLYD